MPTDKKADFNYNFKFDIVKDISEKGTEKKQRIIKGVASVEEIDRDSEVIKMSALQSGLASWMENPVIRWRHSEPIGKGLDAKIEGNKFYITAEIFPDATETAKEAWGLIEAGVVKSFSVAGRVLDTEEVYYETLGKDITHITKMELYEVSVTDLPSNRKSFFEIVSKSLNTYREATPEQNLGSMKQANNESVRDESKNKNVKKMNKETKEEPTDEPKETPEKPEEKKVDFDAVLAKKVKEIEKSFDTKLEAKLKELEDSKSVMKAEKTEQGGDVKKIVKTGSGFEIAKFGNSIEETFPFAKDISDSRSSVPYYTPSMSSKNISDSREKFTFKEAYLEKYTYTQTGDVGTAGYALVPVYVDPDIIDRTRRALPMVELLSRRAVKGMTFDYNAITALTNAVWLPEDASLADLTDTYDRFSVSMKYLYSTGRVTGPMMAGAKGYVDILANEVKVRTLGIKREEDSTIFNGVSSTNPNEFDGFDTLITTNATALGGALTISAMRTEITQCKDAGGVIDLICTTNTVEDDLKGLLMDYQRYVNSTELAWGIQSMTFDGIPVITDRYATSGYMYFLDTSVIFMAVLQDMTYEELAKTNDSVKFTLKQYLALVIQAEAFCSILTGIT